MVDAVALDELHVPWAESNVPHGHANFDAIAPCPGGSYSDCVRFGRKSLLVLDDSLCRLEGDCWACLLG